MARRTGLGHLLWTAAKSWSKDNVPRLGASLAYYTLFSIAPVLVLAIAVAGYFFGAEAVRGGIVEQIDGLVGTQGAVAVQELLEGAANRGAGIVAIVVGSVTFILASTGAFLELQHALNTVFRVKVDTTKSGLLAFIRKRAQSFGLVLSIAFLLLVSLALSAAFAAASAWMERHVAGSPWIWMVAHEVASLALITVLFALIYRFLPDVRLGWRDVWIGAAITSCLFTFGKQLIGIYLARSDVASTYGSAASVVILLLWVYYTAQVILYGAELTRVAAEARGKKPAPDAFARRDPQAHPTAATA
jgi:membrane protein